MPSMHTMAQPKAASHKLKHGFSCSIISHELAERYGFHVCIPCQNFQDKQREVAAGMVQKNAVVDEQRGPFACNCRPHMRDSVRFRVTSAAGHGFFTAIAKADPKICRRYESSSSPRTRIKLTLTSAI
jgi:hypothetical protein